MCFAGLCGLQDSLLSENFQSSRKHAYKETRCDECKEGDFILCTAAQMRGWVGQKERVFPTGVVFKLGFNIVVHHKVKMSERVQEKKSFNISYPFDRDDMDAFVVSSA